MIESILIATDGSDAAHVAERFGAALAGRLRARCYGRATYHYTGESRDERGPPNPGLQDVLLLPTRRERRDPGSADRPPLACYSPPRKVART